MYYIGLSTPLLTVAGKPSNTCTVHGVHHTPYTIVDAIAQWTPVPQENLEVRSYLRNRPVGSSTATGETH